MFLIRVMFGIIECMNELLVYILGGIIVVGLVIVILLLLRKPTAAAEVDSNQLIQTVLTVAKEKFEADKQQISADVAAKKDAIELLVKDLRLDIDVRQKEIRQLEQDRNLKFGEISKSIEEHKRLTADLQTSTSELSKILSNSQLRGGWGERAVQQIFQSIGFVENRHYFVQKSLNGLVKPDFTVMLPEEKKLIVDAKFPLANLQAYVQTENKDDQSRYSKAFAVDVRTKVKEISEKYISEADGTCDYAVMFVPSEAVFDFVNRAYPEVVDEAMNKKVLMASPYSLVAIVRTVSESYRNFYYESSMREIVKKVDVFLNDWRLFEEEFDRFGKGLSDTVAAYDKITTTRYRMMNNHIRQIQDARSGTAELGEATVERGG